MEASPNILIVDDDEDIRRLVARYLEKRGFRVVGAPSAQAARQHLETPGTDLMLLDLMLRGEGGLDFCRALRAQGVRIPIIMLTALGEEADRVLGLESGADDYLPKPFSARELSARIAAVLRRSGLASREVTPERLAFAGFVLDPAQRTLSDAQGQNIDLTGLEFELLLALARRPRRVMSRDQLLDLTRGGVTGTVDRAIDVQISRIRRKLRRHPDDPDIIKTVRYGGYVFASEVIPC